MFADGARRAIHCLSLFNVTVPGLDLCLFRKKKKQPEQTCLAPFNVFVLWFPNTENMQTDESSRLILYPSHMTDLLPAMFLFLLSLSLLHSLHLSLFLSSSFFSFALMMQLIKLREEVSASLLWQFQFCFPHWNFNLPSPLLQEIKITSFGPSFFFPFCMSDWTACRPRQS